jgi:hypothetical protein
MKKILTSKLKTQTNKPLIVNNTIVLFAIPFLESSHEIMNYAKIKLIDIDNSLMA